MSRLSSLDHTFGGNKISQSWHDLFIWESILNEHPPSRILELGTFTGGMSVYLHVQAILRDATFCTYDIDTLENLRNGRPDSPYTSAWKFPFVQVNVMAEPGISIISTEIQLPGRTILFCDNGNKEEEARIYTSFLKEGDILAVHDWGTECHSVPEELILIVPGPEDIYTELESMTRWFIKGAS